MTRVFGSPSWMYVSLIILLMAVPFVAAGLVVHWIGLLMYTTLALGWNLQGGYLGDISFGHAAFFGLGAYTVALLTQYGINLAPLNVLIGAVASALLAAVIGLPFLRLKGFYFAIGTLGLSSLLLLLFKNILASITRGAAGIMVPPPQVYHIEIFYYSILGIALMAGLVSFLTINSNIGLAFRAVRDNPSAARALGINVTAYRVLGFGLSAFIVAVAGGFQAYYSSYVSPEGVFAGTLSFEMLVMVFLGGAGTLAGPVVGAAVFYVFQEVGRTYIGQGFYILPALIMILVFVKMPGGVLGILRKRDGSEKPARKNGTW